MHINLTTPMSDDKERQQRNKAVLDAIEQYTEERMNDEYGRIHTDGSRSGGQPKQSNIFEACDVQKHTLIVDQDYASHTVKVKSLDDSQPTQSDALREALGSVIALLDAPAEPPNGVVSVQDYARWANARIGLGLVMIAPRLRAALQEQSK